MKHETKLDVLVDVIRQVDGEVGPTRGVLGRGGGTGKAPLPLTTVLQTTTVAGDLAVPVASRATALSVVGAVHQTGAGLLVECNDLETAVVGREAGIRRGANLKVATIRETLAVRL